MAYDFKIVSELTATALELSVKTLAAQGYRNAGGPFTHTMNEDEWICIAMVLDGPAQPVLVSNTVSVTVANTPLSVSLG